MISKALAWKCGTVKAKLGTTGNVEIIVLLKDHERVGRPSLVGKERSTVSFSADDYRAQVTRTSWYGHAVAMDYIRRATAQAAFVDFWGEHESMTRHVRDVIRDLTDKLLQLGQYRVQAQRG